MAFVNLPPNLQDIFNNLSDRIAKLESGPNSAAYTADTASSQATTALSTANTALANASTAYTAAVNSLQPNAYTITNSTQQITAIDTGGITVYSGSATSGARVVMNSAGLAGYDSGGSPTFAILASTGAASFSGSITGSAITGSTLNISGNCIIDASGHLTATGAAVTGTITTSNITATGGTIGGFSISSTFIGNPTSSYGMSSSTGNASFNILSTTNGVNAGTSITAGTTATITGNTYANSYLYNGGHPTTTSSANTFINSITGLIARVSSSERYKVAIEPQAIPAESILALAPKSFVDKAEAEEKGTTDGLPRYLGLIAEDLAQIPVLKDLLVVYNDQGQPDAVNYDRIAIALIPIIQDMAKEIAELKAQLNP